MVSHDRNVLGWYIPGHLEPPLGNRLLSSLAGPFQEFSVFCIFLGPFGSFFLSTFFRFLSVRVQGARHRGQTQRRRKYQRVLARRGGVESSAVAAFVTRRFVCLGTREKHEWPLSGLHLLHISIRCVRVYKGRSGLQGNFQAVLIFATGSKFTEGATESKQQHCRPDERRPR